MVSRVSLRTCTSKFRTFKNRLACCNCLQTISTGLHSTWTVTNSNTGNVIHVANKKQVFTNVSTLKEQWNEVSKNKMAVSTIEFLMNRSSCKVGEKSSRQLKIQQSNAQIIFLFLSFLRRSGVYIVVYSFGQSAWRILQDRDTVGWNAMEIAYLTYLVKSICFGLKWTDINKKLLLELFCSKNREITVKIGVFWNKMYNMAPCTLVYATEPLINYFWHT